THLRGRAGMVAAVLGLDRKEEVVLFETAARALERTGLADVAAVPAGALSLGQLRLVEIARALALDPLVLLLDEPAAGLRVGEKKALARLLRELRQEGITVLLVEHDMELVFSISDRITVLHLGKVLAEGEPAAIRSNPVVVSAYLGSTAQ
ncbi:ATP-binding cassette domain-containing protein, partial [Klebsiella pneumoniae]|uniref:ABC transporter ATP-binding protein C-terminal domain-containing protein n=1 Tax=Klebsiella pneumoniae TaxID=573 RepID=UPI003713654F